MEISFITQIFAPYDCMQGPRSDDDRAPVFVRECANVEAIIDVLVRFQAIGSGNGEMLVTLLRDGAPSGGTCIQHRSLRGEGGIELKSGDIRDWVAMVTAPNDDAAYLHARAAML